MKEPQGQDQPSRLLAFTGGGSAGHVTPNLAVIEAWQDQGGGALYIGRAQSVEASLLADYPQIQFKTIPSERLRRYFHWANFIMPFIVLLGIVKSFFILRRARPLALFSKGGFVALPAVIGAWLNRIPVIIHESDGSLGLANRLSLPFTRTVCLAQKRAAQHLKHKDIRITGSPLRRAFYQSDAQKAQAYFSLLSLRPLLVVFGGSLGAKKINETVWESLDLLLVQYEVVHVVGQGHLSAESESKFASQGYHQIEYIREGFADLLAAAHIVVCRAGANAVAELIALKTPALLIPLSSLSSRGDQKLNAEEFVESGGGLWIENEALNKHTLLDCLERLESSHQDYQIALEKHPQKESTQLIIDVIIERKAN